VNLRVVFSAVALAASSLTLCHADSIIYAMNAGSSGVQVYDANTGALMNTIDTTEMKQNNGRGVVKVGNILYYTAASSPSVFAYNLQTNADLGVVFSVAGTTGLATMAYDGHDLYLGDYSGTNNVYKYSLAGTLLQTIPLSKCSGYCDGLEYAKGDLVSNETDGGYGTPGSYDKYDVNGNLIKQGFITTSFGATGIGFDGTDYWVSDLRNGKLDEYDLNGNLVGVTTLQNATGLIEDLSFDYKVVLNPSPEPASILLLGGGLAALVGIARRRRTIK
jgi:hypothetical protein